MSVSEHLRLWESELLSKLLPQLADDPASFSVRRFMAGDNSIRMHLAVFREPFLTYLLQGKKTIESRFSMVKQPPYNSVSPDDVIVLKESSADVRAICLVKSVWFYELTPESWREIDRHAAALCMDSSEFWTNKRQSAAFATLMTVGNVRQIRPFTIHKPDPRSWAILGCSVTQESFPFS